MWTQNRQQLVLYVRFHSMVAPFLSPHSVQRCLSSFTGRYLSMPATLLQDAAAELRRWDKAPLGIVKYYWWTFTTLRALSTLLCLTDIAEAHEFDDADPDADFHTAMLMCSSRWAECSQSIELSPSSTPAVPIVEMHDRLLTYLVEHSRAPLPGTGKSEGKGFEAARAVTITLARRLELNFRLTGTRLIALHFKAMRGQEAVRDADGNEVLHVVEVYEEGYMQHLIAAAIACGMLGLVLRRP